MTLCKIYWSQLFNPKYTDCQLLTMSWFQTISLLIHCSVTQIDPGSNPGFSHTGNISIKEVSLHWGHQNTLVFKNHRSFVNKATGERVECGEMGFCIRNFLSKSGKLQMKANPFKVFLLVSDLLYITDLFLTRDNG